MQYGFDVHKVLYDEKMAPELIHYERLPGGWIVVMMEKIIGPNLEVIIEEKGFVHGDLR